MKMHKLQYISRERVSELAERIWETREVEERRMDANHLRVHDTIENRNRATLIWTLATPITSEGRRKSPLHPFSEQCIMVYRSSVTIYFSCDSIYYILTKHKTQKKSNIKPSKYNSVMSNLPFSFNNKSPELALITDEGTTVERLITAEFSIAN